MNRQEKEKEIAGILKQSETIDREPPYRALPIGSDEWIELKAKQILSLFPDPQFKWIDVKNELPDEEYLCVIYHYNEHMEIAHFDGNDWWVLSNKLSEKDEKIEKEFWPDYWLRLQSPHRPR